MPTSQGYQTTTEQRAEWDAYRCRPDLLVKVAFPTSIEPSKWPAGYLLPVAPETATAWLWMTDRMNRYGMTFDELAGGTYNCRVIAGTTGYSLHSYGIAFDLNPSRNPYGSRLVYDHPYGFIQDVLNLRTVSGARVFRWGGDWDDDPDTGHNTYDAMHFEIACTRADLASGLLEEPMALTPEEEKFVKDMYAAAIGGRWQNEVWVAAAEDPSDGSAFGPMVDLVRASRGKPPHSHSGGTGPVDLSGLVTKAQHDAHDHAEGVTGKPRTKLGG